MQGLKKKLYINSRVKKFDPVALFASIAGLVAVVYALGYREDLNTYIDLRSFLIVVCGTLASILFQFDFKTTGNSLFLIFQSILGTPDSAAKSHIRELDEVILSNGRLSSLRDGEAITGELINDIVFMHRQGLLFDEIDEFITSRIQSQYLDRKIAVDLLRRAAVVAPALGLFGTVIGLIGVLKNLSDPSLIGPSMSLALMTTAYGAGLGSLVFTPLSGRLEHHNVIYLEAHEQLLSKIGVLIKREDYDMHHSFRVNREFATEETERPDHDAQ